MLELTKLATLIERDITDFFKRCYADTYYRDLFAIGQKIGLNPKQARMDNDRLEKVLAVPWSGRNYSSRIWENQSRLAQTIKETVMNGVHRGLSVPKMSAEVARCMEVGKSQAVRLVRTEMNYVQNQAILDSIRSSGLKYYPRDKKILFLNSKYDTVEKLEAFLKKNSSYFSNTEIDSVIMHELGYKYYYDAIETLEKKKNISYNEAKEFLNEKIAGEISRLRITEGFDIKRDISWYANEGSEIHNFSELVAEIHASYKMNSYSKRLMRFIEGVVRNDVITH